MKQVYKFSWWLFFILAAIVLVLPATAWAGDLSFPFWGPLVACDGDVCESLCDLTDLAQRLIYFGLTILTVVIAPIMLVLGGGMILMAGGSTSRLESGKKILKGAVIGVTLGLLSFTIVATFLWLIGNKSSGTRVAWPDVQCVPPPPPGTLPPPNGDGGDGDGDGGNGGNGAYRSHESVLAELRSFDIRVISSGNCVDVNNPSCTSLYGLGEAAIRGLGAIKNSLQCLNVCGGCDVVVTAGTETGHVTHGVGKSIVDLQYNPSTNCYVFSQIGTQNPAPYTFYNGADGYFYYFETDPIHWHTCFNYADCQH